MEDFQQRVVAEKDELDTKIAALKKFFDSDTFKTVPIEEQKRLQAQAKAMDEYSNILHQRIAAF